MTAIKVRLPTSQLVGDQLFEEFVLITVIFISPPIPNDLTAPKSLVLCSTVRYFCNTHDDHGGKSKCDRSTTASSVTCGGVWSGFREILVYYKEGP